MSETSASYAALLKSWYTDERVRNLTYQNNPLFALMEHYEEFYGNSLPIPIIYGDPQGASHTFATAVTNKGSTATKSFALTTVEDYSLASISRKVIKQSENKKGAWMPAAKANIDGALHTAKRRCAINMYRGSSGSIGQLSATSGVTTSLTLADTNTVTNFEVGQVLVLSTADGGGTVKTGTTTVTAVNRDTGVLTVSPSVATFSAVGAVNDYIFVQGDYDLGFNGLAGWIPSSAPGATSFYGVDRSVDPVRLGGVRYDGSALPVEEALIEICSRVGREGGNVSHIFVNNAQFRNLMKSLGSKVQRTDVEVNAKISFQGVELYHDQGKAIVLPDPNCQSTIGWALQLDTWKLYSTGPAIDIFDRDNDQEMLREATADSYEVRCGGYMSVATCAPGFNGRVTLPTV